MDKETFHIALGVGSMILTLWVKLDQERTKNQILKLENSIKEWCYNRFERKRVYEAFRAHAGDGGADR